MPVISKDLIKEALMDKLGGTPAVGAATFSVQFAIARELLQSGVAIVLEGAFFREQQEIAELAQLARTLVVSVTCQLDVLEQRYLERNPQRHPGHRGPEALPDLRQRVAKSEYGIPEIQAPVFQVDTTNGFNPALEEIIRWVRRQLETVAGEETTTSRSSGPALTYLSRHEPPNYECPFCQLAAGQDTARSEQRHIVERTSSTLTFVSPRFWPNNKGALVVVPLEHHENLYELPDDIGAHVHAAVRRAAIAIKRAYGCDGTSTRQHNEPAGSQDVWHYHVHVFPRYAGDELYRSTLGGWLDKDEMAIYAQRLRMALTEA